jgi:hypothetical protein
MATEVLGEALSVGMRRRIGKGAFTSSDQRAVEAKRTSISGLFLDFAVFSPYVLAANL